MRCMKCGKELDHDGNICDECLKNGVVFEELTEIVPVEVVDEPVPQNVNAPVKQQGDRMHGFAKALLSTIFGNLSVFLMSSVLSTLSMNEIMEEAGASYTVSWPNILIGLHGIVLMIISMVFGVRSIKTFIADKEAGRVKPIATLVCGIIGVVASAIAINLAFCWLVGDIVLLLV